MASKPVLPAKEALEVSQSREAWTDAKQEDKEPEQDDTRADARLDDKKGRDAGLLMAHKPGLEALRTMQFQIQSGGGTVGGLAKSMRANAWKVMSIPLDECASPVQKVALLTDAKHLSEFEKSTLDVIAKSLVIFPGIAFFVDTKAVLMVLCLPNDDISGSKSAHGRPKSSAEQVSDLMKAIDHVLDPLPKGMLQIGGIEQRKYPLHDTQFNLAMSVQASGTFTESWSDFAVKFFKWREDDLWYRAVAKHFGFPVAGLFVWEASYIRNLWILASFGVIFTILEGFLDEAHYDEARPFFCLAILFFGACVSEFDDPEARIIALARAAGLDVAADEGAASEEATRGKDGKDEQKVTERAQYIVGRKRWERWARTCILVPCVVGQFMVISFVFVSVFWFEMYVVFEWGQCARINSEWREEHGEHSGYPCRTSEMYRGYWPAFILESLPSITEGLLFELLVGISKSMAALVCNQQNWRTEQQYQYAFFVQVFLIEMIGKVGFVCVLAFSFTPNWTTDGDCLNAVDSLIFGSSSLSCIKVEVPYELRKAMLKRAMRGPMMVSMLVGLTIKVLLPRLCASMVWASRRRTDEERSNRYCWPCKTCGRWFARLLALIFIFDCDAVGGFGFVKNKMMHLADEEEEEGAAKQEQSTKGTGIAAGGCSDTAPAGGPRAAGEAPAHDAALADGSVTALAEKPAGRNSKSFAGNDLSPQQRRAMVEGALHEGLRKEFTIGDEYLEVVLHFTYFSFFGLVWPMGCLFALVNFLLEYRFDVAKLGHVRRRPIPKQDRELRKLLKTFAMLVSLFAIPFNVLIMLLPFEVLVIWFPQHFTEEVTAVGHNTTFHHSMDLTDYTPYWILAFFLASLGLLGCSALVRIAIRAIRRADLQAAVLAQKSKVADGMNSLTESTGIKTIMQTRDRVSPATDAPPAH